MVFTSPTLGQRPDGIPSIKAAAALEQTPDGKAAAKAELDAIAKAFLSNLRRAPNDSLISDWSATFAEVLANRDTGFRRVNIRPTNAVSDNDLLAGKAEDSAPKLAAADDCLTRFDSDANQWMCKFTLPQNTSRSQAAEQYVRMVRLLEKATNSKVSRSVPPEAHLTDRSDFRMAYLSLELPGAEPLWLTVTQNWAGLYVAEIDISVTKLNNSNKIPAVFLTRPLPNESPSAEYLPLPPSQRLGSSGSGPASIEITNDTKHSLNLEYQGPSKLLEVILPGQTRTIQLPPGNYRVTGRVSSPNVLPFSGLETYGAGDRFSVRFFLR